jgi:hypothetical protein
MIPEHFIIISKTFFTHRYRTLLIKKTSTSEVGIYFDLYESVGSGIRNVTVQKGYQCKKNRELGAYVPDMGAWRNPETGAATKLGSEKFHKILYVTELIIMWYWVPYAVSSVPDPNPPDPNVFGPPGSGSISQRYGSGSSHQVKIVRKSLILTVFDLFWTLHIFEQ